MLIEKLSQKQTETSQQLPTSTDKHFTNHST